MKTETGGGEYMVEFIQQVNNRNKDDVLSRYTALGWGFKALRGCGDQLLELLLVWSSKDPPVYPDLSDLL